jgi:hypothetical protein
MILSTHSALIFKISIFPPTVPAISNRILGNENFAVQQLTDH